MIDHFATSYHKECVKANRIALNEIENLNKKKELIDLHISESNRTLANHIGKLLIIVYNDAKKLTLSAFSFPSRYIAAECARNFDFNNASAPIIPLHLNAQYVNPVSHLNLLNAIVASSDIFENKLKSAITCSIHVDGSVDRKQLDKIYIILKIVTPNGELETLFVGVGLQTSPGSEGLMNAVRNGIVNNVGQNLYAIIMSKVTSICTDGANVNRGENKSLWTLLEAEVKKFRTDVPFIKMWCSAHRVDLIWGDLVKSKREVDKILSTLSSIASFFHNSSLRLETLKKIATENKLTLLSLPKLFEVRWTEWMFNLVQNSLRSWNALVLYFESCGDDNAQGVGFLNFLKSHENLKLLVFLCDLLHVYKRFHKNVQSANLTIVTLDQYISTLKTTLNSLSNLNLIGGWEEMFQKSVAIDNEKVYLRNIELVSAQRTRKTNLKSIEEKRREIIDFLVKCLEKRFERDNEMMLTVSPFLHFDTNVDIRKIHEIFATDLDLATLALEYNELIAIFSRRATKNETLAENIKFLSSNENSEKYDCMIKILSRIQCCTPQSADVERLIKSNNVLKTAFRSTTSLETENKYLYVYMNMPALDEWNPRNAIVYWLKEKQRREHSDLIDKDTFRKQRWFKGTFSIANESDNEDHEQQNVEKEKKKKNIIQF